MVRGKKPVRFNLSFSRTQQFQTFRDFNNPNGFDVNRDRGFSITGVSAGLAKRVQWPDDFFTISHALGYQLYEFNEFNTGLFNFNQGSANALSYTLGISRSSQGPNPIYPMTGSNFSITAKFTPPFSLIFNNRDFAALRARTDELEAIERGGTPLTVAQRNEAQEIEEERFKWLEYYKVNFKGDWYTTLVGKLVLRTNAEFGFLGNYNSDIGDVPFERFFLGGDGLGNFTLDGRDNIQLRGYDNNSLSPVSGSTIYNKFSTELRYPLTLKPAASIYALSFLEAGNAFDNFNDFNPFQLKRSAGVGLRIFMPAFGLLGIDFGYGFDDNINQPGQVSGWQTHFIIGQQF